MQYLSDIATQLCWWLSILYKIVLMLEFCFEICLHLISPNVSLSTYCKWKTGKSLCKQALIAVLWTDKVFVHSVPIVQLLKNPPEMHETPVWFLGWRRDRLPTPVSWAFSVAQLVKNLPAVWETWVHSLGWEDPLEKGKATHSSSLENSMDTKSWTWLSDFHIHCYPT